MSDQTLREALEKLAANRDEVGYLPGEWSISANSIRRLLAAHPAETTPVQVEITEQEAADYREQIADVAPLLGPRPLLDREAVRQLLQAADGDLAGYPDRLARVTDLILELARPMPTQAQIRELLATHQPRSGPSNTCSCKGWTEREYGSVLWEPHEFEKHQAEAVLALLNGAD